MELKKNDRVIHGKRLGTVMSDMGYYHTLTKESYIDVLLDGEEHICQIRKDFLKKVFPLDLMNRLGEFNEINESEWED